MNSTVKVIPVIKVTVPAKFRGAVKRWVGLFNEYADELETTKTITLGEIRDTAERDPNDAASPFFDKIAKQTKIFGDDSVVKFTRQNKTPVWMRV